MGADLMDQAHPLDMEFSSMTLEPRPSSEPDETSSHDAYRGRSYLPELDGIRGIAVVLVISFHLQDALASWFSGYLGVTIFFVLSGYLITRLGLAEERRRGSVHLPSFFVRRIFRLMPLYYLSLSMCCLLYFGFGWTPEKKAIFSRSLLYYLTYFQEFALFSNIGSGIGVPFVHTWSLGIEEKYYLVWPFIAFVAWRGQGAVRLWGTLALTLLFAASPTLLGADLGRYFFSYSHILIGCFMALLLDDRRWFARLSWLGRTPVLWLVLLVFLVTHDAYRYLGKEHLSPYHTVYAWVTAVAMASILLESGGVARFLGHPALMQVGRLSYAMYLVHGFALKMAEKIAPPHTGRHLVSVGTLVLATLFATLLAYVLSVTVERPFIKLGRKLSEALKRRAETKAAEPSTATL